MNKKAQGLPLNTIIIAIIVIVALVVIILIFTGQITIFQGSAGGAGDFSCVDDQTQFCSLTACEHGDGTGKCGIGLTCCVKSPTTSCFDTCRANGGAVADCNAQCS